MRNNLAKVLAPPAIFAGVITAGVMAAAPANAAMSDCPSGASCFWGDKNFATKGVGSDWIGFQQQMDTFVGYYYTCRSSGCTNGGNDTASSIYNNGNSCKSYFYIDAKYGNLTVIFDKKAYLANLQDIGKMLSSGRFIC